MKQDTKQTIRDAVCEPRIICRSDFVFVSGTIAVLAGLLLPLPTPVLDVLLIFNLSLTAAVLMITFSAQEALQVQSFPLLIVLVTGMRLALTAACAKLVVLQGNAGTMVRTLGQVMVNGNPRFAVSVFSLLVTVIFGIVCKLVKGISQAGAEFVSEIVPTRQTVIDNDLNGGVINEGEALSLRTTIAREQSFFVRMTGAAKFILCSAVIEFLIILLSVAASIGVAVATTTSPEGPSNAYTTSALGGAAVTQISLLIVVLGSAHLVRKSSILGAPDERSAAPQVLRKQKRIRVVAEEVVAPQRAGLQFRTTLALAENVATIESKFVESESAEMRSAATGSGLERSEDKIVEERECASGSGDSSAYERLDDSTLWAWQEIRNDSGYEPLAELIRTKSTATVKTVLMAAECVAELPVTIPVNIALCLALKRQRCLLVDLDSERDAVSRVFQIYGKGPEERGRGAGRPTCISNLSIWPASNFGDCEKGREWPKLKGIISLAKAEYDYIILYAPQVPSAVEREKAADSMDAAILFGRPANEAENTSLDALHKLLIASGCEIIRPADILGQGIQKNASSGTS